MPDQPERPPGQQGRPESHPPGQPGQPDPNAQAGQQGGRTREWLTDRVRDLIRLHQPPPPGTPVTPPGPPPPPPRAGPPPTGPGGTEAERGPTIQRPRFGGGQFHNTEQAAEIAQAVDRAHDWWKIHRSDIFGVPFRQQTYSNMAYLLLQFPLGLAYFLIIALG